MSEVESAGGSSVPVVDNVAKPDRWPQSAFAEIAAPPVWLPPSRPEYYAAQIPESARWKFRPRISSIFWLE